MNMNIVQSSKFLKIWLLVVVVLLPAKCPAAPTSLVDVPAFGLRIPRYFRISVYANDNLVHDVRAMTVNARGQLVVSGPGYIKVLKEDARSEKLRASQDLYGYVHVLWNGDSKAVAESSVLFAQPTNGADALYADGTYLYAIVDGVLCRYSDTDGDNIADGEPEKLLELGGGDHGMHSIRKGPDGYLYVITGSQAGVSRKHASSLNSPVHQPEAGAVLRLTPDGMSSEVITHGLNNPQDLDFNWLGDLFTFESETPADLHLPWYTASRFTHLGHGLHHGWKMAGTNSARPLPEYYPDVAESLATAPPGKAEGIKVYRHIVFPEYYQEGMFAADWARGQVLFVPLTVEGASYSSQTDIFMESMGTQAFAPTDIEVASDGSLWIASGGQGMPGMIYRVQYVGGDAADRRAWELDEYDAVFRILRTPQPFDAWGRAYWVSRAINQGQDVFGRIAVNEEAMTNARVRAIEILTEAFNGLSVREARMTCQSRYPEVRARAAWSLGRIPCTDFAPLLLNLTTDRDAGVRRCALEAMGDRFLDMDMADFVPAIQANLNHADKRVRLAAARLAALLPPGYWNELWGSLKNGDPSSRLAAAMAGVWRTPVFGVDTNLLEIALSAWKITTVPQVRLDAVRLMITAWGEARLTNVTTDVFASYESVLNWHDYPVGAEKIRQALRPAFPSGNSDLDWETARLLAFLEDSDSQVLSRLLRLINSQTLLENDFHYLAVMAKLPGIRSKEIPGQTAAAIMGLDRKLQMVPAAMRKSWQSRFQIVFEQLIKRDPGLGEALLRHPDFAREGNLPLAVRLGTVQKARVAALFLQSANRQPNYVWSEPLVELLSVLPPASVVPLFRHQWANPSLRDEIALRLTVQPDKLDRAKFLYGLNSARWEVVEACVGALRGLPSDSRPENLAAMFRLLKRLASDPKQQALRGRLVSLLEYTTGRKMNISERGVDDSRIAVLYQPVILDFTRKQPDLARWVLGGNGASLDKWQAILKQVPWSKGNAKRGETVFQQTGCADCHAQENRVGPDLRLITPRSSPTELMMEVNFPYRTVADEYRLAEVETRSGNRIVGRILYESSEDLVLQLDSLRAMRLHSEEIRSYNLLNRTLMPDSMLEGMAPSAVADLHSFLNSLQVLKN
jgi:putative heme-binding domain-containing protein